MGLAMHSIVVRPSVPWPSRATPVDTPARTRHVLAVGTWITPGKRTRSTAHEEARPGPGCARADDAGPARSRVEPRHGCERRRRHREHGRRGHAAKDTTPRLQRQGRFLVDQYGRVVIIHGLNMVWKRAPYAPPDTPAGFTAKDAAWLAKHGFNGARRRDAVGGVTPKQPGVADPAYFKRVDRVTELLADKKIWMLFDGHQDMWHEQYGGEGAPDWAAKRPQPFALAPYVKVPFPQGYWTPEVSTVFDNFWADKAGLQTAWADGLEAGRAALPRPALLDGLRPDERAVGRPRVAELPDDRVRADLRPGAAAGDDQGLARGAQGRRQEPRLVGAAAVRGRPEARHLLHRGRGGEEPRLLVAQLLPRRVLREPGHPGRRHRELPGLHRRPREPRDRAGRPDERRRR